ncbi:MAG: flagellar protein FlaG [Gammaproteobacteria bacterium]|nr:flagellar protein FlaG [Gammaproteobacteria bacterium]
MFSTDLTVSLSRDGGQLAPQSPGSSASVNSTKKPEPRQDAAATGTELPQVSGTDVTVAANDQTVSETALTEAIATMNERVQFVQRNIEFSVDEESGRTIVRVRDSETGDIIRQMPPEELLAVVNNMKKFEGMVLRTEA